MIQWLELRAKGVGYPFQWAKNRIAWEIKKRQPKEETAAIGQKFHNTEIEAAFLESVETYSLHPWDGPLTLFRPPLVGKMGSSPGSVDTL